MKVEEVTPIEGKKIKFEDDDGEYIRYGSDCWYMTMGESDEPLYDCIKQEQAYQDYYR